MHDFLIHLLIYLSAAVIAVPLFRKFKIGAILAYLFVGALIGPQVFRFIEDPKAILHLSELGVVFLLFIIGLELKPSILWKMRQNVFGLGGLQVLLTGSFLMLVAHLGFGLSWSASFIAGFGLSLSSTAFGIQILEENHQLKTHHGQGSFSILLFQDLAVVPLIAAIPLLSDSTGPTTISLMGTLKVLGILCAFLAVGIFLIRYVFRFIAEARVSEVFTAASLLVVVGSAILMESIGMSMGMGAFLSGVLLANSEYRHELEVNLEPFKGLLLGLFFIAVGMSLDLQVIAEKPLTVAGLVLGLMAFKALVIFGLARIFKFPNVSARNMAFTLPQGGEFAFVLFAGALSAGLLEAGVSSILNAAVTLTMVLTPIGFKWNQRMLEGKETGDSRPTDEVESEEAQVIIAGFGRFGQIVSRMLQADHIPFTILEHSAAQVDTARKFGAKIYYGDASRKEVVQAAGAKDAKLFVLAIDDVETSIETAKMVKENFPHLNVVARVRNRGHAIELLKLGIDNVHRETYLTSLEVAKEVLLDLGRERDYINKRLAKFRKHDEQILRGQKDVIHDEKQFLSYTTKANSDLAEILQADARVEPSKKQSSRDEPLSV